MNSPAAHHAINGVIINHYYNVLLACIEKNAGGSHGIPPHKMKYIKDGLRDWITESFVGWGCSNHEENLNAYMLRHVQGRINNYK